MTAFRLTYFWQAWAVLFAAFSLWWAWDAYVSGRPLVMLFNLAGAVIDAALFVTQAKLRQ